MQKKKKNWCKNILYYTVDNTEAYTRLFQTGCLFSTILTTLSKFLERLHGKTQDADYKGCILDR